MILASFAALALCAGLLISLLGGDLYNFLDPMSLIAILIPLLGVLTATQGFKVFWGGLKAAVLPKAPLSEEVRGQAASLFRLLSKVTAIAAGAGMFICLTNALMMLEFSNPNFVTTIFLSIAASLVAPVYGLVLIVGLFEPVVYTLKKRREAGRG